MRDIARYLGVPIVAILMLASTASISSELRTEVDAIFAQILTPDGVLTEEMHRKFWARHKELAPPGRERDAANAHLRMMSTQQEYQREMWASIRLSFNSRTIVKSQRLLELRSKLLELFVENVPFPKDSADYRSGLAAYESGLAQSDQNLEMLLNAAAFREQLVDESGEVFEIDLEMIEQVLGGLDAAFRRVERLMNPEWSDS